MNLGESITVISIVVTLISVFVAIISKTKNTKLEDNKQQVHNSAERIIQNNYFISLPQEMQSQIKFIYSTTGSTLGFKTMPGENKAEK